MKAQQYIFRTIGLIGLIVFTYQIGWTQCTTCDHTISGNFSGNINASNGDVVCITSTGNFSGNLNGNNLTICNNGIISSQNFNPSNYTFYNYGTMNSSHLNINNNCVVHNYGTIGLSGQLNVNNGGEINNHFLINVAGHMHVNGVVKGNISGGNGRINVNGQTNINNGGTFGVIGSIDLCDSGNPSGGWDNNNGTVGGLVTYCSSSASLTGEFISQDTGHWNAASTWGNSGNTPGESYPASGDSVVIQSPHRVRVTEAHICDILNVHSGGKLVVKNSHSLEVENYIENNGNIVVNNNASIIQSNCSSENLNVGTGIYRIKRNGADTSLSYNIWSSPVENAILSNVFSSSNPCDVYTFDGGSQSWGYDYPNGYSTSCNGIPVVFSSAYLIPNADGIMDQAQGYFIAGSDQANRRKKFNGTIHNGTIKKQVEITGHGHQQNWNDDDWNLVGNPYPSAISAALFWQENAIDNNRIFGAIHFWDDGSLGQYNQYNEYATWNSLGGVSSNNSAVIPTGNIASCQGFWIEASQTDTIEFNNCMRNGNNSQFYKNSPQTTSVYLTLSTDSSFNLSVKNTLIGFNDETTNQYDALYDAHQIADANPLQLASLIDSGTFVIQGVQRPDYNESTLIPLFVKSQVDGTHTISASQLVNLPNQLQVFLTDNLTGERIDLKQHDMEVYLDSNVGYYDRFELELSMHIGQLNDLPDTLVTIGNPLPVNSLPEPENLQLLIQEDYILLKGEIQENSTVTIYNILGQTLMQQQLTQGSINPQIFVGHVSQPVIVQFKNSEQQLVRKAFL